MKFDKDTLIKHRFWILLGVAVPLSLLSLLILATVVSARISKARKSLEDELGKVEKYKDKIMNDRWVAVMREAADEKKKFEEVVWKSAYDEQKTISTWPREVEDQFHFQDGLFPVGIKLLKSAPQDASPGKEAASTADEGPEKHEYQFTGRIETIERNWMEVKNGKEAKTFQRTPAVTRKVVTDDGKEISFVDLRAGNWVEVTYEKGRYFGDPLTDEEQRAFAKGYSGQIAPILAQVNPVSANGRGVVILKGWPYRESEPPPENARFLIFKSGEWKLDKDISDEAWMAQEDLWVQREIYRLISVANEYVSHFKGKGGADVSRTYTFTNPYWRVDLKLVGPKKLAVKITNQLTSRQKLDFFLAAKLSSVGYEPIPVGGHEPLNPQESFEFAHDIVGRTPAGIFGLEQVLTWETAAVKRIDQISLGSLASECCHSHRTFPEGIRAFREEKKTEEATQAANVGGEEQQAKLMAQQQKFMGAMAGGMAGGQKGGELTPNGLRKERYVEVTRQARRIPVGLSLIVDQNHVDRVLTAFSNSKLRFLTTQVIMNRYPNSVRPSISSTSADTVAPGGKVASGSNPADVMKSIVSGAQGKMAGFGAMPDMSKMIGSVPPGMMGGMPFPSVMQPGAATSAAGGDEDESNFELVIYGIVSLYERYPPRPEGATAPPPAPAPDAKK
jgi:hypothetical protein